MGFKPFRGTLFDKTNKLTERFSEIALELEAVQTTKYDEHSMAITGRVQWSFPPL